MLMEREGLQVCLKRCLIALLVVCFTAGLSLAGSNKTSTGESNKPGSIRGSFTFAIIGDTRSGGKDYSNLVKRAMTYRPDFMINTGDMVSSPTENSWADFRKLSEPVTVPYFLTVGNHDVNDPDSEKLYKEEVDLPGNELYYSFTTGDSLFVFLDSNIPGRERKITGEQYRWLEEVLSTSLKKHQFIFIHHPLYPDREKGHHYGGSLDKYPEERDRLAALLVKYKSDAIFVGHEHLYSKKTADGVMHIITGGGGAGLYTSDDKGGFYHFILVTVDGKKVTGKVIDINGKVRDTFQL
jgi:3',5'-cyclic AMP phosphodiesterase CpdA